MQERTTTLEHHDCESEVWLCHNACPLVLKDKVIIGSAGGEYGIRGFIAAYDAHNGREVWRFNTIQDRENLATKLGG